MKRIFIIIGLLFTFFLGYGQYEKQPLATRGLIKKVSGWNRDSTDSYLSDSNYVKLTNEANTNPDALLTPDGDTTVTAAATTLTNAQVADSLYNQFDSLVGVTKINTDSLVISNGYMVADSFVGALGDPRNSFADYVFKKDYVLQSIIDEYKFTQKNSRLRPVTHTNNIARKAKNNTEAIERNFLWIYKSSIEQARQQSYIMKLEERIRKLEKLLK